MAALAYDTRRDGVDRDRDADRDRANPQAAQRRCLHRSLDHTTGVASYRLRSTHRANVAIAAPLASSDLGPPVPDSTGTISVDRATFFAALPSGSYLATVTAVGSDGQTQGTAVAFSR